MQRRGHTLRLAAVSALVVLALTGFTGRHSHSHGGSGGGSGCSSSHQDHDTTHYHHHYVDDDDYTGGSTSGSGDHDTPTPAVTPDPTAELVSCATKKAPYATVEVTNPTAIPGDFTVHVDFDAADGTSVAANDATVTVPAHGTQRVRVKVTETAGADAGKLVAEIDHCAVDPAVQPAG